MQAEIALQQLLHSWPDLHQTGPALWNGNAALRGLATLPVATGMRQHRS